MTEVNDMDTWTTRDFPVLRAIVKLADENENGRAQLPDIVERTGLDKETVKRALRALENENPPLFKAVGTMQDRFMTIMGVSGEARRKVGAWPTPEVLADRIVEAMNTAAEQTNDDDKRGWLRNVATWFSTAGRDILVDVAAKQITG